jgi:lipoyl(octanoyl) transferase
MERRVAAIEAGTAPELFWLLEHPPLYTTGTSATADEVLDARELPVFETGRGGRTTYHGPGQRVIYALCDLRKRDKDVRAHVARLEEWVILTLAGFGIAGERRQGRVGIWVAHDGIEEKIAALGVRVRRWIAYHGLALNVHPDLSHYKGIVPCGLPDFGVTSMHALGVKARMVEVDAAFRRGKEGLF